MLLFKLGRYLAVIFLELSVIGALIATAGWAVFAYVGLFFIGETDLVSSPTQFIYWLLVTASTVGYGDLSPQTPAGMMFTSFFVIPFGLSFFAVLLTKFGFVLSNLVSQKRRGFGMTRKKNHCVIIGWNASRTHRLIELLLSKNNLLTEKIVLCVDEDMENPLSGKIDFIRVDSYINEEDMMRAGIDSASRIVLDLPSDDITLTTALLCRKLNPDAHKTAYFKEENIGKLLKVHCPQVEVIPSVSVEMLARATLDPGSSAFHQQLLDSTEGTNQYSLIYESDEEIGFESVFNAFKYQLNSTLVGMKKPNDDVIHINAGLQDKVERGTIFYYYANQRIDTENSEFWVNLLGERQEVNR